MEPTGIAPDGTFLREGSPDRVRPEFAAVVAAARQRIAETFGDRLHSAYLYGSVPRGTARPGRSDLDLLIALRSRPTEEDRAAVRALESGLDAEFPEVDGVGALLWDEATLLSDLERWDMGFFVAVLCTPLLGEDLAGRLPAYRPDTLLARELNGDLDAALARWGARAAASRAAGDARDLRALARVAGRKLVRTGFTLVMPVWGGWTSDLQEMAEVFGTYYPERGGQMRAASRSARRPNPDTLPLLVGDLGPWLAAEYTRVHGVKAARPYPG
ncbi:nucleotidyltransferase domain-containing protein [Streptomyces sp. NPDC007088]|uniref:nucleotidyltransferase domain-containing protein n=1 Tax=Streptomyces sp. NPDC007088 TaxID=3364773 RepID=UPI003694878E